MRKNVFESQSCHSTHFTQSFCFALFRPIENAELETWKLKNDDFQFLRYWKLEFYYFLTRQSNAEIGPIVTTKVSFFLSLFQLGVTE